MNFKLTFTSNEDIMEKYGSTQGLSLIHIFSTIVSKGISLLGSIMPIYRSIENDDEIIEPNKDIPFETMVENYYKKKIGTGMSEETKSVLMEILGEDKEDK